MKLLLMIQVNGWVKMEPLPGRRSLYIECELRWTEGGVQECNDWRGMAGIGAVEYELQGWCRILSADEVIKDANYVDIREFCTPEVVSRTLMLI